MIHQFAFNSIVKLVCGGRRSLLTGLHVDDEITVRTSLCADDVLIDSAVRLWAAACDRRTAQRQFRKSGAEGAESSSEGVSLSDSGSEYATKSSLSESSAGDQSMAQTEYSEGSSSAASILMGKSIECSVPEKIEPVCATDTQYSCLWFQSFLSKNPVLRRFEAALKVEGFDTRETFAYITVDDMARLSIPPGVRRLLEDAKKELAVSSNQI